MVDLQIPRASTDGALPAVSTVDCFALGVGELCVHGKYLLEKDTAPAPPTSRPRAPGVAPGRPGNRGRRGWRAIPREPATATDHGAPATLGSAIPREQSGRVLALALTWSGTICCIFRGGAYHSKALSRSTHCTWFLYGWLCAGCGSSTVDVVHQYFPRELIIRQAPLKRQPVQRLALLLGQLGASCVRRADLARPTESWYHGIACLSMDWDSWGSKAPGSFQQSFPQWL